MSELIPIRIKGMVEDDNGRMVEGMVDSTQVFELHNLIPVNSHHTKYEYLGTVIRGKRGWMSVVADDDLVFEHRLKRQALERIESTPRELGGQARGSRLR